LSERVRSIVRWCARSDTTLWRTCHIWYW